MANGVFSVDVMKLIYFVRPNILTRPGGDTIQLLNTKRALEALNRGFNIVICHNLGDLKLEIEGAAAVHFFGIQNPDLISEAVGYCKRKSKKIFLSTIYWDFLYASLVNSFFEYFNVYPTKYIEMLAPIYKKVLSAYANATHKEKIGSKIYIRKRSELISKFDFIFPNSNEELNIISSDFLIDLSDLEEKSRIIPNAGGFLSDIDYLPIELNDRKKIILQVGRIEPTKNQINVIKAISRLKGIRYVVIGNAFNRKYYNHVKLNAQKSGNITLIPEMPHEMMKMIYSKARLHILPSFRESPGLASLEAYFNGAGIIVAGERFCPTKFYKFDKIATVCDPFDISSIRNAIEAAFEIDNTWNPDYLEFISYEYAARKYEQSYLEVC
jgi:glycosyltransferase involved in cell wall biosynthesis